MTAKAITHYYVPERMARTYGNQPACCARPAEDHPAFVDGTTVKVALTRPLTSLRGRRVPAGTVFVAERESFESMVFLSESRWGLDEKGRMCELERAKTADVRVPGYTIDLDGVRTGITVRHAREVS